MSSISAMQPRLVVVGAGGHAKVVIATARAAGYRELHLVDHQSSRWGEQVLGLSVAGGVDEILADESMLAILAIGDNTVRMRLATSRCQFATLVHPSAVVDGSVLLGSGSVVFAGAVIQPDSRLGPHAIVNTSASIDHDCAIGTAVHIAPGVRLAGNVTVGDGAFVGVGVAVIPNVTIGQMATVGAGATVIRDVPAGATVVGTPARSLR